MNHDLAELRNPPHAECPDHAADCNAARAFVADMLDESKITPAALEALGFIYKTDALWYTLDLPDVDVLASVCEDDGPMVAIDDGDRVYLPSVRTIGQLRMLTAALTKGPSA